ncbi:GatB/YqeY domain-containing protein [Campylobacter sp. 19-13652]|uniref:GatB/YqeY domain-containing protein n=1 Tax=Campylobacter sp. 19-13652 TaxID=2840180 RepID=UPI001C75B437|nr:GatB/YqeY domain-containing protein [Campylobacter sp. 19-13652]BCX79490.1 aspartyl-tRNA amidotransferase subunit B [Campylobacter sp. 19-13652]
MTLKEQILNDIKSAMKSKDDFTRDTLRQVNAALKQIEVDTRKTLSDEEIVTILQKEVKKRQDAATLYVQGGRDELAKKENDEIKIISNYLPTQLSDEELKAKISQIISELKDGANLGAVIKLAKERLKASAEARRISEMAKSLLS